MLEKTRGILIKTTKYSESSLVVKIYTELLGMRTYLVRGVRKKKSKTPLSLFQMLSVLDLVVYEKQGRDIQNIKEIKPHFLYATIPYEIQKTSIAIFINELIYKSIQEEEPNTELFRFIIQSLLYLDESKQDYQNFHLLFMMGLSRYLGFEPSLNYQAQQEIFDLQEGRYTSLKIIETASIHPPLSKIFFEMSQASSFSQKLTIHRKQRQLLLEKMIQYYQFHLQGFGELKSLDILKEIMR